MKNLGLGVMLGMLSGKNTIQGAKDSLGRKINRIELDDKVLNIYLYPGDNDYGDSERCLSITDEGQSCCESRYMSTDDDLKDYEEAILLDVELKDAPSVDDKWGSHDIQFLDIKTSKGVFTISNHNEHNGYYGGFCINAKFY